MRRRQDFNNCSVLVVGGTSGINLGIAEGFAAAGARVGVASRSQEKVDAAVEFLSSHGGQTIGFSGDVRQPDAVQSIMVGFDDAFGNIDVLVSGAAGNFPAPAKTISPMDLKRS